jgi:3-hydroxyisobutyrate dehydrogenase-like beta-hydroxyacid dehydrogenase
MQADRSPAADLVRVAFLGLGRMGAPMAENVARAGFPLVVYNRTAERARAVAQRTGAEVAATPREAAAGADVVVSMLADGEAVRHVYLGEGGVVEGLRPGSVAVDMSTVGPVVARDVGAAVERAGGAMVDAPVSGSVPAAQAARLMVMAGGGREAVERVRPVLEAMGSPVLHTGPLGSGQVVKLAVNTLLFGLNQAVAEALVLAERAGVERQVAYEAFLHSAAAAPFVQYKRAAFEDPETTAPAFTVALAVKDLRLIVDLARTVGVPVPQAEQDLRALEEALAAGLGERDMAALASHLRSLAGPPPTPSG